MLGILRDEDWAVRRIFAKRTLRRRVIALAAAYAIALSSLIASFGAARAAADMAAHPGGVICHSVAAGKHAPASGKTSNNKTCADSCCAGCLMLMAALPPPPANAAAVHRYRQRVRSSAGDRRLSPAQPDAKSHRSRAPPSAA